MPKLQVRVVRKEAVTCKQEKGATSSSIIQYPEYNTKRNKNKKEKDEDDRNTEEASKKTTEDERKRLSREL